MIEKIVQTAKQIVKEKVDRPRVQIWVPLSGSDLVMSVSRV
jgi:hypothetical protein